MITRCFRPWYAPEVTRENALFIASIDTLLAACQRQPDILAQQAQSRLALWENWLLPVSDDSPTGDDPGYDDDFQQMREEVNKLSGADTDQICTLAEKLLTTATKDIRVAHVLRVGAAVPGG